MTHTPITSTEPILMLQISPSSVTISPNDQFTVTCTARTEVDGQSLPVLMAMSWIRITKLPSGSMRVSQLRPTEYNITTSGSPESGYQSILTTTENDTVNMIIYRCIAKPPKYSNANRSLDVTVTFKGM